MTERAEATLGDLQRRLATSQRGGAPGVLVSGLVWVVAGIVTQRSGMPAGFLALFVGGMFIHPVALLVARSSERADPGVSVNPLERAALEGTFVLFAGLLLAWLLLRQAPELVFVAVALAIGARYFLFRTLYGNTLYWLLGATILVVATLTALRLLPIGAWLPVVVGAIELAFGSVILMRHRRSAV